MNIPIKFIDNCTNYDIDKIKSVANKLGISSNNSKKHLCKDITKKYTKLNPCNIILNDDSDLKLKKFQTSASNQLYKNRGVVVVHSVGTGKTVTSIATAQCLLISSVIEHVIVITPTSLQRNFIDQAIKYGVSQDDIDKYYTFYTIQGIINSIESKSVISPKNALIIIDEAHNLRKIDSIRFNFIYKYSKKATKIMLLTATPLINYPCDIINLVSLVKNEDPLTVDEFDEIIKSKKLLTDYVSNVFSFYSRNTNDGHFFPSKKIHEIYLPMSKKYNDVYEKIEKGHVSKFKKFKGKNVHVFYNGLRRASNTIEDFSPKINWIINFIKNNPNKKIIIFSHFIEMGLFPIIKYLNKNNTAFSHIIGDVTMSDRDIAVTNYNENKVKIMFISKAGSEGLDLKNTSAIILLEPSWNENTIEQIIGRGVRYKSHLPNKTVNIYKLYTIKNFENNNIKEITNNNLLSFNKCMLSVDLYLRNYSIIKQKKLDNFDSLLIKFSK
jgi:superfamily II DNA or RNA helicase